MSYQELTGCSIDYTIPARCFPKIGDDLLAAQRSHSLNALLDVLRRRVAPVSNRLIHSEIRRR